MYSVAWDFVSLFWVQIIFEVRVVPTLGIVLLIP